MSPDEQPTIFTPPPNGSRTSPPGMWQAPSVAEMQAMLPQYEVLETLGCGGMGAVYKARQKSLKRLVAIKILPTGHAEGEMRFAERFKNEAYAMARLNHPHIVNVHDAGETPGGLLYFVMEHVEGRDLAQEIAQRGRLPQAEVKAAALQVAEALAYAHEHGIVHRDIKPANILLDAQGRVKVADFGLAKLDEPMVSTLLTKSGTSMGTADFMAPETLQPGSVVDARADLFSLGVTIYQMLTGELPRGMFKLPSELRQDIDPHWDEIIWKSLEPVPEDRYQTATEMRGDLERISLDVPALPAPEPDRSQAAPAAQTVRKASISGWLKIAFVVVAALGVSALWITKRIPPSSEVERLEWTDWLGPKLADPKNFIDKGWLRVEGGLSTERELAGTTISPLQIADGAVRVRYLIRDSNGVQITVRERGMGGRERGLYIAHDTGESVYIARTDTGGKVRSLANKPYPAEIKRDAERTLEFRCVGTSLTATLNGVPIVAADDATLQDGAWAIALNRGVLVKGVEFAVLKEGQPDASASTASALATTLKDLGVEWQDVSAEARVKAASLADLVVEEEVIRRRSRKGPSIRLPLMPPSWRDYAIRITHVGDAQIDLRYSKEGFYFALCQSAQFMLRKQPAGSQAGAALLPSVLHPAGFDIEKPHDLVAIVQGDRIRSWIDGRLVCDVRDSSYAEGGGAVMFVPQTQLQRVEIFQLAGTSSPP